MNPNSPKFWIFPRILLPRVGFPKNSTLCHGANRNLKISFKISDMT